VSGLVRVGQDDFGAGMLRGVAPDVQPGVGLFNATNGLFNDDGDVYRRGGTEYYSAAIGAPLTFIWTGYLNQTPRTLVATDADYFGITGTPTPPVTFPNVGGNGTLTPVLPAIVNNTVFLPTGDKWTGGAIGAWAAPTSLPAGVRHVATAAGRLLVATGNRVAFSVPNEPENFVADDYHDLPGGVLVVGMTAIRDTAFIFTNYGLYTISNLAFDLTDSLGNIQQQLQLITPEISLTHEAGLAGWQGRIVAPCNDRVYMVDGMSAPVPLSDSISSLYMDYVRQGYLPGGGKVYRSTYFLPILRPDHTIATVLTCRLNRPVKGRQTYYPWSALTGHAATLVMADFALISGRPSLIGAHSDGRVSDLSALFAPEERRVDADDSSYPFDVETRDFPTGNGQPNHVREVRLRYTSNGEADVIAGVSVGTQAQRYEDLLPRTYDQLNSEFADYNEVLRGHVSVSGLPPSDGDIERYWYALEPKRLRSPGTEPITWNLGNAKRARFARVRFRTEDPVALNVHHVDMSVRQSGHDR